MYQSEGIYLYDEHPGGSRTIRLFLSATDVFRHLFMVLDRGFRHLLRHFADGCADSRVAHMYYCGATALL